jgi:co-chaperonin GroES (HSP10)
MFDRKPFLDRVIVEVTPVEKFFQQSESGIEIPLDDQRVKYRSDRGIVRAVGDGVAMAGVFIEMPVQVEDEVFFDSDNAYAGQIWLLPSDKNRRDLPEYLEIRVGDLLGRGLRHEERERPTIAQLEEILNSESDARVIVQPDGSVRAE